jgi:hypothetical protein
MVGGADRFNQTRGKADTRVPYGTAVCERERLELCFVRRVSVLPLACYLVKNELPSGVSTHTSPLEGALEQPKPER